MNSELWQHKNFLVEAISLAGIRTAITLPQHSICFDVAQGLPHTLSMKKFFITHAHMDHAAGIPYIISQKNLQNIKDAEFYMPESMVGPISEIMNHWADLEKHHYDFKLIGLKTDSHIRLNRSFSVQCFKTFHRVPSLGYTLMEHKKKLKPEFKSLNKTEFLRLKKSGICVEDESDYPIFSYTGDTTIEVFSDCPWLLKSKILFTEVTYLDERKSSAHARHWGHIHLDEFLPYLFTAQCEKIIIGHISSRYSLNEASQIIRSKIPDPHFEKIHILKAR